jgi:hypothetical protein
MRFEVDLLGTASDDLARLWTDHVSLRRAISEAVDRAERELGVNAHQKGTSVDNYRTIRVAPLLVLYIVSVGDAKVEIVEFRLAEVTEEDSR